MWPCWGDDIWKQTRRSWENNHVHFYQQWIQKKEKTDRKAMGQKYGDMFQEYQGHQCGCRGISYNCDVLHAAHMLLLRGRNFRDAVKYWNLPAGFRYAVKYWICLHNFRYVVKYWICLQCKRPGLNPWVRKIPWRRKWQPTPIFLLESSMDRGAWWATVHEVARVGQDLVTKGRWKYWKTCYLENIYVDYVPKWWYRWVYQSTYDDIGTVG